jgi:hypothetical protein
MQIFWSPVELGFYSPDYHSTIPADAVEITVERHAELLAGNSAGKNIVSDANGIPQLVDQPPVVPAYVRKLALVRALREVGLDGDPDNPVKAWPLIKAAIEAADEDTREDWGLAVEIPRDDPALAAIAGVLDVPASVLDAVFIRAAQIAG